MSFNQLNLILTLALSFYNVGVIWLMQILIYPQFLEVSRYDFKAYHLSHWQKIRYVVFVPAILVLIGSALMLIFPPKGIPVWILLSGLALQIVTYVTTWLWWAPLQVQLSKEGNIVSLVKKLISTHWLRTGFITLYALLALAMSVVSFSPITR